MVFSTTDFEPAGSLDHLMPQVVVRLNERLAAKRSGLLDWLFGSAWQCAILPYNENCVALRVALRGQISSPQDRRRARPSAGLLQAIESELLALRDQATGEPAARSIARPSSELAGPRAVNLPDLLVHCASGAFPRTIASASLGRIEAESPKMRPGNHAAGGFLIASGAVAAAAGMHVRTMAELGPLAETILCG